MKLKAEMIIPDRRHVELFSKKFALEDIREVPCDDIFYQEDVEVAEKWMEAQEEAWEEMVVDAKTCTFKISITETS